MPERTSSQWGSDTTQSLTDQRPWLARLRKWAWLPIPILLVTMAVLWGLNLSGAYDLPILMMILNFVFSTLSSLFVAYLMARSFLVRGEPGLLMLGCGVLVWGMAGLVGTAIGQHDVNLGITIHNSCVWLSALCHLSGVVISLRSKRAVRVPGVALSAAYPLALGAVGLVVLLAYGHWMPVFFIQGQGGTPLRQFMLSSAIAIFILTAAFLWAPKRRFLSPFSYWYSLALCLFAAGLFGVMIQSSIGSAVGWAGRVAQILAGIYMLMAAFASWREADLRGLTPVPPTNATRYRYGVAIAAALAAAALRLAFLQVLGTRAPFVTFYPAVMLAALYGGLWAGLLATLLSALLAGYFWIGPPGFAIGDPGDWVGMAVFLVSGTMISAITEAMHRAQAQASAAEAEARVAAERAAAAEALRKRELEQRRQREFLECLIANAGSCIAVVQGRELRYTMVNPAYQAIAPSVQMVGRTYREVFPEAAHAGAEARFHQVLDTGEPWMVDAYQSPIPGKPDATWQGQIVRLPVETGQEPLALVVIWDITERVRAEEALHCALAEAEEGQRILNAMMEHIPMGITIADAPDVRVRAVSRYGRELTGRPREQIEGIAVEQHTQRWGIFRADGVTPTTNEELPLTRATQQGELVKEEVFVIARSDGTKVPILCTAAPIRDAQGSITGGVIGWQDITERQRAEEALRESERRYSALFANKINGMAHCRIITDEHGRPVDYWILQINEAYERIIGIKKADIEGRRVKEVFPDIEHYAFDYIGVYGQVALEGGEIKFEEFFEATGQVLSIYAYSPLPGEFAALFTDVTERKLAEEALRRKERELREAQSIAHIGSWFWDAQTDVTTGSDELLRIYGFDPATQRMPDFREQRGRCYPEADWERLNAAVQETLRTGVGYELDVQALRDGIPIWVTTRSEVARDEGGRIVGLRGTVQDITERKQVEQAIETARAEAINEQRRLEAVMEALPVAVVITDAQGGVVRSNGMDVRIWGGSRPATRGVDDYIEYKAWWADSGQPVRPEEWASAQAVLRGETVIGQILEIQRFDGTRGFIINSAAPVLAPAGNIIGSVVAIQDITSLRQAEAALRMANAELVEADRRKDEFLAILAHELRNPLAPVRYAIQILHMPGVPEEARQRQQAIIERQITHMARLLDDLLDVSRVTRGKVELRPQPLCLGEVLAQAAETVRPTCEGRHQRLHFTPPPEDLRVEADIDRLAQVVGNLLVNACKFTGEGGQIWLEAAREADQAVIRVRDNGSGIAPEILPRIFDLFVQADDPRHRSQGGLGIGLTLVRSLTQMHGGTVEACSGGEGQGSEFIIRLPALPEEPIEEPAKQIALPEAADNRIRRILVVDDIADSATTLAELLMLWGHEARAVHDGLAAIETVREWRPEIVLLDIGMPGIDGYETARRLREEHGRNGLMLVALTGFGQEADREAAREAGFNAHLVKPVDTITLRDLLARLAD